jgi:hypothetical protein
MRSSYNLILISTCYIETPVVIFDTPSIIIISWRLEDPLFPSRNTCRLVYLRTTTTSNEHVMKCFNMESSIRISANFESFPSLYPISQLMLSVYIWLCRKVFTKWVLECNIKTYNICRYICKCFLLRIWWIRHSTSICCRSNSELVCRNINWGIKFGSLYLRSNDWCNWWCNI